jgi:hypothetical protein
MLKQMVNEWWAQAAPHKLKFSGAPTTGDEWYEDLVKKFQAAGGDIDTATAAMESQATALWPLRLYKCLLIRDESGSVHVMAMLS